MPSKSTIFLGNLSALGLFDSRSAAALERVALQTNAQTQFEACLPEALPASLQANDIVVLLGIGDGTRLVELLESRRVRVVVIEREPTACLPVLERCDLSAAISQGNLQLLLLSGRSSVSREISLRECTAELINLLLGRQATMHFVANFPTAQHRDFYQAIPRSIQYGAQTITEFEHTRSASKLTYDVTVISPCCAIFDELAQCFNRLGLKTQLLRVPDNNQAWSIDERRDAQLSLARDASRLVIARNRALFETTQPECLPQPDALVPGEKAMWWWDVPNLATHIDLRYPRGDARSFSFARDILTALPERSEWLPPGARMTCVEAGKQPELAQDIELSFVGQSRMKLLFDNLLHLKLVLGELGGDASLLTHDIEKSLDFLGLHKQLTQHELEIRSQISQLSVGYPAHTYYLRYLLDMIISGCFRIAAIQRLAMDGTKVTVFGDDDWLKIKAASRLNFMGICPPEELPTIYRRSRINLNLNFMQVSSTVNPKVLDIAATGSVALTDYRPEIELLYPDPAARPFCFYSIEQLPEKIDSIRKADLTAHRKAVQKQTCDNHSLQHRAAWLARRFNLLP